MNAVQSIKNTKKHFDSLCHKNRSCSIDSNSEEFEIKIYATNGDFFSIIYNAEKRSFTLKTVNVNEFALKQLSVAESVMNAEVARIYSIDNCKDYSHDSLMGYYLQTIFDDYSDLSFSSSNNILGLFFIRTVNLVPNGRGKLPKIVAIQKAWIAQKHEYFDIKKTFFDKLFA